MASTPEPTPGATLPPGVTTTPGESTSAGLTTAGVAVPTSVAPGGNNMVTERTGGPASGGDSAALTIGLAVGGSILLLLGIAIIVFVLLRRRRDSQQRTSVSEVKNTGGTQLTPVYDSSGAAMSRASNQSEAIVGHYAPYTGSSSQGGSLYQPADTSSSSIGQYLGASQQRDPVPQW